MKKEWLILFALLGAMLAYSRYNLKHKVHTHHSCSSGCSHHHH